MRKLLFRKLLFIVLPRLVICNPPGSVAGRS